MRLAVILEREMTELLFNGERINDFNINITKVTQPQLSPEEFEKTITPLGGGEISFDIGWKAGDKSIYFMLGELIGEKKEIEIKMGRWWFLPVYKFTALVDGIVDDDLQMSIVSRPEITQPEDLFSRLCRWIYRRAK